MRGSRGEAEGEKPPNTESQFTGCSAQFSGGGGEALEQIEVEIIKKNRGSLDI